LIQPCFFLHFSAAFSNNHGCYAFVTLGSAKCIGFTEFVTLANPLRRGERKQAVVGRATLPGRSAFDVGWSATRRIWNLSFVGFSGLPRQFISPKRHGDGGSPTAAGWWCLEFLHRANPQLSTA
jgi:hypothetical protein